MLANRVFQVFPAFRELFSSIFIAYLVKAKKCSENYCVAQVST